MREVCAFSHLRCPRWSKYTVNWRRRAESPDCAVRTRCCCQNTINCTRPAGRCRLAIVGTRVLRNVCAAPISRHLEARLRQHHYVANSIFFGLESDEELSEQTVAHQLDKVVWLRPLARLKTVLQKPCRWWHTTVPCCRTGADATGSQVPDQLGTLLSPCACGMATERSHIPDVAASSE